MSRTVLGLLAGLLLLATLIINLPARLLTHILPPQQWVLHGLRGTLWHGEASRCLVRLDRGLVHLGSVSWSLRPLSLLSLSPTLEVQSHWGTQRLSARVTLHGEQDLDVSDLEATVPAELAQQLLPVALGGTVSVQVAELQLRDGLPQEARGRLVWQGASWHSVGGVLPLGDYAADFRQEPGQALHADLLTLAGSVEVSGAVRLEQRHYEVDARVAGAGLQDRELQQALSLVATPEDGAFRVRLEGEI